MLPFLRYFTSGNHFSPSAAVDDVTPSETIAIARWPNRFFLPRLAADLTLVDELVYLQLDRLGAERLFQVLTEREERSAQSTRPPDPAQCAFHPFSLRITAPNSDLRYRFNTRPATDCGCGCIEFPNIERERKFVVAF